MSIEDRVYQVDRTGRITSVRHGSVTKDDVIYDTKGSGTSRHIYAKSDSGEKTLVKELYGVQSFCIVDNSIYFCAYVDRDDNGNWYSQIYRANLSGAIRWKSASDSREPSARCIILKMKEKYTESTIRHPGKTPMDRRFSSEGMEHYLLSMIFGARSGRTTTGKTT